MRPDEVDDICPQPQATPAMCTTPHAPPIYPTTVWSCADPDQANALLSGEQQGYVYQRDGHPNADMLAEKCCQLHAAERCNITASGMAALALALLSQTAPQDRILVSQHVYGKTVQLLQHEASRWGIRCELFDSNAPDDKLFERPARLVVVETISNPRLFVANIAEFAERAHSVGALLLVDNTFASPVLCRPLRLGADLVMESITKMMNGHSDVVLGMLCGREQLWEHVPRVLSTWGFASSPWDCWLALRGIASLHLRLERACANAMSAAKFLQNHGAVERVDYPGLDTHAHHALAKEQFHDRYGTIVTFHLRGGRESAANFIRAANDTIPFCPSLGEISTTLSHPQSTSHRGLDPRELEKLGISAGTIRLSCGVESPEYIVESLQTALK